MVQSIRLVEKAKGSPSFGVSPAEKASRVFRRSLFAVSDIRMGEAFTAANVRSIRPGDGLAPRHLSEILGRLAKNDIKRGTPLAWELIQ